LLVLVTILALYSTIPLREYLAERSQAARLEREVAELEAANARLLADIARLRDPAHLERLARECLGMVGPGETALIIDPGGERRNPIC
jgi:cell division protein FtsB